MLLLCVCVCMWNVLCYVLMLFVSSFDLLILFFLFRGGRKDPFGDSQLGALLVAAWLPLQKVLQELGQSSWSAWCLRPLLAIIKENANMSSNAHKNICKCNAKCCSYIHRLGHPSHGHHGPVSHLAGLHRHWSGAHRSTHHRLLTPLTGLLRLRLLWLYWSTWFTTPLTSPVGKK